MNPYLTMVAILEEQNRRIAAADKGTLEEPAIVDWDRLGGIEKYVGVHLHDLDGTCRKKVDRNFCT